MVTPSSVSVDSVANLKIFAQNIRGLGNKIDELVISSKGWLLVRPGAIPPGPKRGAFSSTPHFGPRGQDPQTQKQYGGFKNKMADSKTRWRI